MVLIVAACGGGNRGGGFSTLRSACPAETTWDGARCVPYGPGGAMIDQAETLLAEGEPERATAVIERAERLGPHRHQTHVRLYEQLGKAYAFQDKEPEAVAAYLKLLALSPGHLLSYHVSTKATFKFEKARRQSEATPATQLDVGWPDELDTRRPVPIDIEVVADPMKLLARAVLRIDRGAERRALDLELPPPGQRKRVVLPALGSARPETLKVQLVGLDARGNEVALWAADRPRSLRVDYTPPTPWYRQLKIMIPLGVGTAAIVGSVIYVLVRPPSPVEGFGDF